MKVAVAIALLALGACRPDPTAVHVYVSFEGMAPAQIEFAVLNEDRAIIVPPTLRPEAAGPALNSPQDVVVYLPDVFQTVICQVRAVGPLGPAGEASVMVAPHRLSRVFIDLASLTDDGGLDGPADAPEDGEEADGGVDVPPGGLDNGQACVVGRECASGYCADDVCCTSSCVGTCRACDIPSTLGVCTAVAAGQPAIANECPVQDPSTCGTNGLCDGQGACQKHKCDAL